jgi:hypothetical protein
MREQAAVEEARRMHPAVRFGAFLVGVASVLVLVALFIPRAEVVLQPESRTQNVVFPVVANPSVESVFITGTIPAREKLVIVSGTHSVVVTGEGTSPQSRAKGVVTFRNLTQQSVTIPAGTVVRTEDHIRFLTSRSGTVPAGVGETLDLPVEAVESGRSGNAGAETIVVVEGRLGLSLSVANPEPLTGGREVPSVQATAADRERAKRELMEELEREARAKLVDQMAVGDVFFDDTFEISQILSEGYDPPPGAAATRLSLSMQVEFSGLYASAADLAELAALALNASLPSDFRTVEAPNVLTVRPVTTPVRNDDGAIRWTVRAERRIARQVSAGQVTHLVQGTSARRAKAILEQSFPLDGRPEINLSPEWWPWVPIVPFRISVST